MEFDSECFSGVIENIDGPIYKVVVKLRPVAHHYEKPGDPPYVKYSCPVCEMIGLKHQVFSCDAKCPNCGVNLLWGEDGTTNV